MTIHPFFQSQRNAEKALFLSVLKARAIRTISITWSASMQIYWNKRKRLHKKRDSQRIGLGHQHGRRFIVLEYQYGRRDVTWKHSTLLISEKWYNGCTYESGSASLTVLLWRCLDAEPSLLASPSRCLWRWWWWCDLKQNKNTVTISIVMSLSTRYQILIPDPISLHHFTCPRSHSPCLFCHHCRSNDMEPSLTSYWNQHVLLKICKH